MKKSVIHLVLILSVGTWISCDRPACHSENAIFNQEAPESEVYKSELAKQLKKADPSQLSYWLKEYKQVDGVESLNFYVQGDGLCAVMNVTVNDWKGLEEIRERKGVGRRGAEFKNLRYEIVQQPNATAFIYQSFDYLID